MRTIKLITTVLTVILISNISFTQENIPVEDQRGHEKGNQNLSPDEKANKRTKKITEELGLDENQSDKLLAINLAMVLEMEKLKKEFEALKKKKKELHEKTKFEIEAILTPDQKLIWDKKIEERRQRRIEQKNMNLKE